MLKEFGVNDIVPHFCFSNRTKQGSEGISLGGYKAGLILGSRLLDKIPLIGCGQGMHLSRGHCKTHLPAPLGPGSGGAARSQRRNRAARRAAGAGHSSTASPGSRERLPGPSGRSYGTTPFRIGRALNPGAGIRSRTLLGTGHSGERTCGGATSSPAARLGGGWAPLRGSAVGHWLPAVSLGTWRRRSPRPLSGWAKGRGEALWTRRNVAEGACGPLDLWVRAGEGRGAGRGGEGGEGKWAPPPRHWEAPLPRERPAPGESA